MALILLIDDDVDLVEINQALLQKKGHRVITAYNVADGYARLNKEKPDLVILDVMMEEPDDGFALAQRIRREKNPVPIIMLTSVAKVTGMKFDKDDAMVPVNEYFEKPVPADVLLAAVAKYVKG